MKCFFEEGAMQVASEEASGKPVGTQPSSISCRLLRMLDLSATCIHMKVEHISPNAAFAWRPDVFCWRMESCMHRGMRCPVLALLHSHRTCACGTCCKLLRLTKRTFHYPVVERQSFSSVGPCQACA